MFGENVMYSFCEHAMVGFAAAHLLVTGYTNIVTMAWNPVVQKGLFMWLVPLIAGAALYLRFVKPVAWIAKIPLALLIGAGTSTGVFRSLGAEFVTQITSTVKMAWSTPNNIIYIATVLAGLVYFVVSVKEKSVLGRGLSKIGKVGQCLMMIGFGASLAGNVGGTLSYLIGRLNFLFGTWLGLLK
jgi:hypothetical protein